MIKFLMIEYHMIEIQELFGSFHDDNELVIYYSFNFHISI